MKATFDDVRWLAELASRDEPPAVRLFDLKRRGLTSGTRDELGSLQAEGCEFILDTRDSSVWIRADDFVRGCARVAARMGPIIVN